MGTKLVRFEINESGMTEYGDILVWIMLFTGPGWNVSRFPYMEVNVLVKLSNAVSVIMISLKLIIVVNISAIFKRERYNSIKYFDIMMLCDMLHKLIRPHSSVERQK